MKLELSKTWCGQLADVEDVVLAVAQLHYAVDEPPG